MNDQPISIKRALISVSHKEGIIDFARALSELNIEIISTGGTSKLLREAKIAVRDVSDVTGFPEIMDGRVKTLHPKIHGGILGLRDLHQSMADTHEIKWIDLVVVNLYPFVATTQKANVAFDEVIENIDIGGPAMLRSAAKNMGWAGVIVDPLDYQWVLQELHEKRSLSFGTRKILATKAFAHTGQYDAMIHYYLEKNIFPDMINLPLKKQMNLRYGENPHQAAAAYKIATEDQGILKAVQYQGKELSYNNIADSDAAFACVQEFKEPACVIVKHANPCGVAMADTILSAFEHAFASDSLSAFGGVIALNETCTKELAETITKIFFEVIIAPKYTKEALAIFSAKLNIRVLELPLTIKKASQEMKFIEGGVLIQEKDNKIITATDLKCVTHCKPIAEDIETLLFAWRVVKHIKSNAILLAKHNTTIGIGAGQVSRVHAVEVALKKAGEHLSGSVLASDAFFPFRDSIDCLANTGVRAIIQPGGSMRDEEVIAACDEYDIAMVFTGVRSFRH